MSRIGTIAEKLLAITPENGDVGVELIFGTGAPGGAGGEPDDAPVGSIYLRTDSYKLYKKDADTDAAADWIDLGSFFDLIGVTEGDLDLGTFTGDIISDSTDIKTALQELETYIENILEDNNSQTGVIAETVIDSELVDEYSRVVWEVTLYDVADRSKQRSFQITGSHNGHSAADATTVEDNKVNKHAHGASFNRTVSIGLSGAGAAQVMQLKVASTEVSGVDVFAKASAKVKSQG